MRIVSLLASGTEIACDLGLAKDLVGISHECDHPPEILDRPRVSRPRFDPRGLSSGDIDRAVRGAMETHGSVYEIDGALLRGLRPDLILAQAVCEVCAVPTADVRRIANDLGLAARVLSLDAHTLPQILDGVERIGKAAGRPREGRRLARRLARRMRVVSERVSGRPAARVLAIEWLDPPFAPGHWVPEMIRAAGGACLVGAAGERSRQVAWSEIRDLDPDVLLIMPCGYGLDESRRDADRFASRLREAAPRAVAEGRAFVVDGSAYFNRSGPRVARGVEILGALLHPEPGEPVPEGAERWQPSGRPGRAPPGPLA
ncbi:MAG: ABC transporter substrate-binding protein [Gemmatimonadota bacterium]